MLARSRLNTSPARSANSLANRRASFSSTPWNSTPSIVPSLTSIVTTPDAGSNDTCALAKL
jgi:hypothetical protein